TPGPTGSGSDIYLHTLDQANASSVSAGSDFLGDYSGLGHCSGICFDVRLFNDGNGTPDGAAPHTVVTPSFDLFGGGFQARFTASATMQISEDLGTKPGWRHICAPMGPIAAGQ